MRLNASVLSFGGGAICANPGPPASSELFVVYRALSSLALGGQSLVLCGPFFFTGSGVGGGRGLLRLRDFADEAGGGGSFI